MSFNGSGTYSLPAGNPVVTGTTISSTTHNNTMSDVATALSTTICKDGQTTITANIPLATFRLTGVGDATALQDAITAKQVQNSTPTTLASVAGTNTVTGSATPTPGAYAAGQVFSLIPANTNTGATTLNVSSLGAKNVFWNGAACVGGELRQNIPAKVLYDGTQFHIIANGFNAPFLDTHAVVEGSADSTKKLAFEVDGFTTATTRTVTVPDESFTMGVRNTAAQTFLGADVNLNNTANYFNVVDTGSIGAAGQVWKISAVLAAVDTAGTAQIQARIWDGSSTVYVETPALTGSSSGAGVAIHVAAVVTLSAATTFHLSARDSSSTSGIAKTTGSAGTANKATWIMAERIS